MRQCSVEVLLFHSRTFSLRTYPVAGAHMYAAVRLRRRYYEEAAKLRIEIPGGRTIELDHLVSDLNGTLALDGTLLDGVAERLAQLSAALTVHVLTAGTHGGSERVQADLAATCHAYGVAEPHWEGVQQGTEKAAYVRQLGGDRVVALGNGANDVLMFGASALAIGVLGGEGMSARLFSSTHVLTASPHDALDLLLHPDRLIATMRP